MVSDFVELGPQRVGIGGIALEHGHRDRDAPRVGQQAVVDLQLSLLAVPVVAAGGERAGEALEVAGAQVVEGEATLVEVTCGQLLLDVVLAL